MREYIHNTCISKVILFQNAFFKSQKSTQKDTEVSRKMGESLNRNEKKKIFKWQINMNDKLKLKIKKKYITIDLQ